MYRRHGWPLLKPCWYWPQRWPFVQVDPLGFYAVAGGRLAGTLIEKIIKIRYLPYMYYTWNIRYFCRKNINSQNITMYVLRSRQQSCSETVKEFELHVEHSSSSRKKYRDLKYQYIYFIYSINRTY